MPKAVIFDVDGTLVDSVDQHAQAWQDAFRDFGHDVGFLAIRGQIGKGGDQLMPALLGSEALKGQTEKLEERCAQIFKKDYLPLVTSFPGVRALFQRLLADGWQIALVSSAKRDELDTYKRIAGIDDLIQAEATSDDAEKSKPCPDIFRAAMRRLHGCQPGDVIVVGDAPYDAQAAGQAGLRTIGVLCGGFAQEDLRAAGCIAIYQDPANLLANYESSPLARR